MLVQLALGSALLLVSIMIAGFSLWFMESGLRRFHPWLTRRPHAPKLVFVLCGAAVLILGQMTVGVWVWALAFLALDLFVSLEEAVYFALVSFTTLGFGDILLPQQWRLLGGLAAANGLLNVGVVSAVLVESLRGIRALQMDSRR